MTFRLRDAGSDTILEAEAPDLGSVLVEVAKGFSHITTSGDIIAAKDEVPIEVRSTGDGARLLVAFVDELVFLFATRGFLPAAGRLEVELGRNLGHVRGRLEGEAYDSSRHRLGTEVKAATLHGARLERVAKGAVASVLVDL